MRQRPSSLVQYYACLVALTENLLWSIRTHMSDNMYPPVPKDRSTRVVADRLTQPWLDICESPVVTCTHISIQTVFCQRICDGEALVIDSDLVWHRRRMGSTCGQSSRGSLNTNAWERCEPKFQCRVHYDYLLVARY